MNEHHAHDKAGGQKPAGDPLAALEALVRRFAKASFADGKLVIVTDGEPAFVDAFAALGWSDPYEVPEPPPEPPAQEPPPETRHAQTANHGNHEEPPPRRRVRHDGD